MTAELYSSAADLWTKGADFLSEVLHEKLAHAKRYGEKDEEYKVFIDKFKPKLTTDDCFTPPRTYEAVKKWAINKYDWQDREIVVRARRA